MGLEEEQQPGFEPAGAVQHLSRLCYAGRGTFITLTSAAIKSWSIAQQQPNQGTNTGPYELSQLALPQQDYVSALCACIRTGLLFGACLDGSLRIWSLPDWLVQRSACPWDNGTMVLQLMYNAR